MPTETIENRSFPQRPIRLGSLHADGQTPFAAAPLRSGAGSRFSVFCPSTRRAITRSPRHFGGLSRKRPCIRQSRQLRRRSVACVVSGNLHPCVHGCRFDPPAGPGRNETLVEEPVRIQPGCHVSLHFPKKGRTIRGRVQIRRPVGAPAFRRSCEADPEGIGPGGFRRSSEGNRAVERGPERTVRGSLRPQHPRHGVSQDRLGRGRQRKTRAGGPTAPARLRRPLQPGLRVASGTRSEPRGARGPARARTGPRQPGDATPAGLHSGGSTEAERANKSFSQQIVLAQKNECPQSKQD
jgi:hypothetical protein